MKKPARQDNSRRMSPVEVLRAAAQGHAKPLPVKRLRQRVIEFRDRQKMERLFAFYKEVVVRRIEAPDGRVKNELRLFEDEVLVDLEPKALRHKALFWRTLCEKKTRGRRRQDDRARDIALKRKNGKSWGQIGNYDQLKKDSARSLFRRYKKRTGQKLN